MAEGYAIVRDIQRRALANDPHADMIATYPTGNSYIHPAEKLPVAEYASLWALAKVYKKPVQHIGNTYRETKIQDNKLYLFFDIDPIVLERWKDVTKQAYWQVLPCPREGNAEFQRIHHRWQRPAMVSSQRAPHQAGRSLVYRVNQ